MDSTSIETLYVPSSIKITESLKPYDIPKNRQLVDSKLLQVIKQKYGNKCNHNGYIEKDSIEILERSIGEINSCHFNGEIYYSIKVGVRICTPNVGSHVTCRVIGKNQAGVFCVADPFQIIVSPDNHDDTSFFDSIEKGDNIVVEIIRYQILLNHDHIKILGKFHKKL